MEALPWQCKRSLATDGVGNDEQAAPKHYLQNHKVGWAWSMGRQPELKPAPLASHKQAFLPLSPVENGKQTRNERVFLKEKSL